jgi:hypothetical protein
MTDTNIFAKELNENEEILWQGSKKNKIFSGILGLWPKSIRKLILILIIAELIAPLPSALLIASIVNSFALFIYLFASLSLIVFLPIIIFTAVIILIKILPKEEYALTNERIIIKRNNNIISAELSDIIPSFIEVFTEKNNTGSVTFLVDYYMKNSIKKKRYVGEILGFYGIDNPSEVTKQLKYLI